MRVLLLAAVSALALAACSKPTEPASSDGAADSAAPAAAESADAAAHDAAGHGMAAMDDGMKASDAADDANTAETPEGHTFHTFPNKVESVHLPVAEGEVWTAAPSDAALVSVGAAADETMPDGAVHHVVKVTPLASGNASVLFERRPASDAAAAPSASRTINFMIH